MKILVTGAHGFAGKHLTELLKKKGHQILAPDVDLLNATAAASALAGKKFDGVIHLAAIAAVGQSYLSPAKILRNNIFAQLNLLENLRQRRQDAKILIVCSADEYGHGSDQPIDESAPLLPASPYAVSKIGQDFLGLQYHLAYGMKIVRVRPFNHIGERQAPGFVVPDFAKQIAEIEAENGKGTIRVGNLSTIRDFTDVKDMVKAYELALFKGESGQVYNLGSGKGVKIKDVLEMMIKLSSAKIKVEIDKSRFRPADEPKLICNSQKFQKLTGWEAKIPLEKTLKRVLEWWRREMKLINE